ITYTRIQVRGGDTLPAILSGLDFARPAAPPSQIDATQVAEIAAMAYSDLLKGGDWIFVAAASERGAARQVVVELSISDTSRRRTKLEIRLEEDGKYSKYESQGN